MNRGADIKRRKLLAAAALAGVGGGQLLGCGGSGGTNVAAPAPSPLPPSPPPVVWDPSPLLFIAGSQGRADLSLTLPSTVVRGGSFSLAATSSPLPPQISLSPSGILSAANPVESLTSNVVFSYVEPG